MSEKILRRTVAIITGVILGTVIMYVIFQMSEYVPNTVIQYQGLLRS